LQHLFLWAIARFLHDTISSHCLVVVAGPDLHGYLVRLLHQAPEPILRSTAARDQVAMLRAHLRDLLLQASGSATLLGFLLFDITAFIVSEGTSSNRGDFDYLDFRIPVNLLGEDRNSFGGLSGGGVWRIWVFTADNARGFEAEATLFGVAFHQSQIVDGERSIRCHGPKSLARALSLLPQPGIEPDHATCSHSQ
jgi:hypothetical protein